MFEKLFKRYKHSFMRSSVDNDEQNDNTKPHIVQINPIKDDKELKEISDSNIYDIKSVDINGEKIKKSECAFKIAKNQAMTNIDIVVKKDNKNKNEQKTEK